jgi:hypothetical protein
LGKFIKWAAAAAALIVFVQSALAAPVSAAASPQEPKAMVEAVYQRLIADQKSASPSYSPPETIYTPKIRSLIAVARRQAKGEVPCGLDFMIWVNGQDYVIKHVTVSQGPSPSPDRTSVTATFQNQGTPEKIVFDFQRIAGRWLVDDAHSVIGDDRWTFSRLLRCQS